MKRNSSKNRERHDAHREQLIRAARDLHGQLVHPDAGALWPYAKLHSAADECGRLLVALLQAGDNGEFARYERIHSLLTALCGELGFQIQLNADAEVPNPFVALFADELDQHHPPPPPWWRSDGPDRGSQLW